MRSATSSGVRPLIVKTRMMAKKRSPFLGRPHEPLHGIAHAEAEALDLARRDVDVVRRREVVVLLGPEKAVAVGQHFENAGLVEQPLELDLARLKAAHVAREVLRQRKPRALVAPAGRKRGAVLARHQLGARGGAHRAKAGHRTSGRRAAREVERRGWHARVGLLGRLLPSARLGVCFENAVDEVALPQVRVAPHVEVAGDALQLGDLFGFERGDVHRRGRCRTATRYDRKAAEKGEKKGDLPTYPRRALALTGCSACLCRRKRQVAESPMPWHRLRHLPAPACCSDRRSG